MTMFDNMLDGLPERHAVVALSMLAVLIALAAVAWWLSRRTVVCRLHAVERRAWSYCPKCGHARPETGDTSRAHDSPLPSDLLRFGWTRSPALDREGRVVLPSDERAVIAAWSLWGAGSAALEAGSPQRIAWTESVRQVLAERHGGMSIQAFNRHPSRTAGEIVALAQEAEIRVGLVARRSGRNAAPV